jgi:hypothetical protein
MTDQVPNAQTLPQGMTPQQQYVPPSQEVPQHQQQPQQGVQPQQQQPAQEPPAPNPMLSRYSQQPQVPTQHLNKPEEQAPVEPQKPQEPAKEKVPAGETRIQDLVGDLSDDVYAKPSITYIENVCKGSDVDLGRAFNKAVEYGDASLIDEAYLREKLGENADAVIQQASSLFEYSAHKAQEGLRAVYDAVGGEETLQQAAKFFNTSAPKDEKAEIQYLLDSGNKDLMVRAAKRIVQYAEQGGMTYAKGKQPLGNPSTVKGLTQAEYIDAITAKNLSQEQYAELRKQRELGRSQGL